MNQTYFRNGKIFCIFILLFMMCNFQSIGHIFETPQSPTELKDIAMQFYQQRNNDDYISEDNFHSFSKIKFPNYVDSNEKSQNVNEQSGSNGEKFFGWSNNSCYIVKVSSSSDIYLDDFDFDIKISVNDKKTSGACCAGGFVTNKSWISSGIAKLFEFNMERNLRYAHFNIGRFNYTYEHRITYNRTGPIMGISYWEQQKPILPPGTWYFIYFGCIYDLPQDDTIVKTSVWINFTYECSDLEISSYDGGKTYGIWYGEFDANIVISKFLTFEMMINGITRFLVDNTFIYECNLWPCGTGFWKVRLITPEEVYKLNMKNIGGRHFPFWDDDHKCIKGIEDRSGLYELQVDYIDLDPLLQKYAVFPDALTTYYICLDVDLH